jgi:hypothetical protein
MRISFIFWVALGVAGLCAVLPKEAQAEVDYPWCATGADGYIDCSFTSFAQCQQTASGIGGCLQNPRASLSPQTEPRRPASRIRGGSR